jgi:hypothetical protein
VLTGVGKSLLRDAADGPSGGGGNGCRVGDAVVEGDLHACLAGLGDQCVEVGKHFRPAYERGDTMALGDGLGGHLPAGGPGHGEKQEFHAGLPSGYRSTHLRFDVIDHVVELLGR